MVMVMYITMFTMIKIGKNKIKGIILAQWVHISVMIVNTVLTKVI